MKENEIIRRIKETKKILDNVSPNDEKYVTILLNSLLSLVVLPTESLKKKPCEKIYGTNMVEFYKATGITPVLFNPIKSYQDGETIKSRRTPQVFVTKLRNGIAHQCIEIDSFDNTTYVRIYNVIKLNKNKKIDFDIRITTTELKKLALYIANCYLNR